MAFGLFNTSKIKAALPTLFAILSVAVVGSMLYLFFQGRNTEETWKVTPQQIYRMQIKGLDFNRIINGHKEISITADQFILRKGKVGFFSFALINTARIENARIDIYAMPSGEKSGNRRPINAVQEKYSFGDLFGEETLSSLLPVKSISSIEAVPVTVRLLSDRGVITQISAASASVQLKNREILFNGRVRVLSGNAELSTEKLIFTPLTAHLVTDKSYLLRRGGRTIRGKGLTTDIFLLKYPE
jgi:hypothetical protein